MITTPSIDIIIPNYNKAKYLDKCLESVINQTYKNWKLYLIDDFSNDDSKKILQKYEETENTKIFYLNKNSGPHYCRNLGMEKSSSEFIAFLDSDDYWPKEKLNTQINEMIKNNYNFTFTDLHFFKEDKKENIKVIKLPDFYDFKTFVTKSTMSISSILLNRKMITDIHFKNIKHEDYLFKCDILKKGINAFKIKETFVYYRFDKKNRSSNKLYNLLNLWNINKKYNNLNFFKNIYSVISISINSLINYGWK